MREYYYTSWFGIEPGTFRLLCFFFFQAEDGIRDIGVTGVQTCALPIWTTMETLVAVEAKRWAAEDAFETAKTELGLDHNETRSWHGWHRHVSSVMLASAMLARVRRHANRAPPPKASLRLPRTPAPSCAGRSGRSVASRPGSRSGASSPPTSSPGGSGDARIKPPRDAAARRS